MTRTGEKNHTFSCYYNAVNEEAPCHGLRISESDLEQTLYEIISKQSQVILNLDSLENLTVTDLNQAEQSDREKQIDAYYDQKRVLYEKLLREEVSLSQYQESKGVIDRELTRLEQISSALKAQAEQRHMDEKEKNARRQMAQGALESGKLTEQLADALIEKVNIFPGNRIDITWKMKGFCPDS